MLVSPEAPGVPQINMGDNMDNDKGSCVPIHISQEG